MNRRYVVTSLSIIAVVALLPLSTSGQGLGEWTAPKTPWGDPDLMGTYTNKTITPVQRPDDLADREAALVVGSHHVFRMCGVRVVDHCEIPARLCVQIGFVIEKLRR